MDIDVLNLPGPKALRMLNNAVVVNVKAHNVAGIADRSRLRYVLEVYVFNGEGWELLTGMEAAEEPVRVLGAVSSFRGAFFDVSSVLLGYLGERDPVKLSVSDVVELPDMTLRFYTVAKTYVDGVLTVTKTNAEQWAYRGGLAEMEVESWGSGFFVDYVGKEGRMLGVVPEEVDLGGMWYMCWMHSYSREIGGIRVKAVGLYAGGGEAEVLMPLYDNVQSMGVYAVPVNLEVVDGVVLGTLPTEGLERLAVWLVDDGGDRVSEVRYVNVVHRYRRSYERMVYMNSLGVPVVLNVNGSSDEVYEFERRIGERFRGFGYEANLSEERVEDVKAVRRWMMRMEWADEEDVAAYMDVAMAKEVYLYERGKWLPLIPEVQQWIRREGSDERKGLSLGFRQGYVVRSLGELPEAEGGAVRATAWRPFSTACGLDSRDRYNGKLEVITLERYYVDTGEAVEPAEVKKNKSSDADYIAPVDFAACAPANTPFLNTLQQRTGRFNKQGCPTGEIGGPATITVAAGSWGSLVSVANANGKALSELDSLDTQAYANTNGTCNTVGVYNPGTIPSGRWWIRVNGIVGQGGLAADEQAYRPGTMWFQSADLQPNQTDVNWSPNRLDASYPALGSPRYYRFYVYQSVGKTLRFFRNGLLQSSVPITSTVQFEQFPVNPVSGDKWYVDVV